MFCEYRTNDVTLKIEITEQWFRVLQTDNKLLTYGNFHHLLSPKKKQYTHNVGLRVTQTTINDGV